MITTPYTTTIPLARLPQPHELVGDGWIIGTVSVAHPGLRRRFTLASHTYEVAGVLVTSRDIARWWVRTYYDVARLRRRSLPPGWGWTPVPHWARRGEYKEGYYVDIRGMHKTIISRVGYDVEYAGLGSYLSLSPIDVLLPKPAYLSLSSLSISPRLLLRKWVGGKIVVVETYNRYANTSLYRLIRDVQRAVAEDVLSTVGAVYYNTDGAIVVSARDVDAMSDVCSEWGLEARIKREGRVVVSGVGAYSFGDTHPAHRRALPHHLTRWQPVFTTTDRDWLRSRFRAAQQVEPRQTANLSWLQAVDISDTSGTVRVAAD